MSVPKNTFRRRNQRGGWSAGSFRWNRLAVWVGALLTAFLAGVIMGTGRNSGVSEQAYLKVKEDLTEAEQTNAKLWAEKAAQESTQSQTPTPQPTVSSTPLENNTQGSDSTTTNTSGKTYAVQESDTLWNIAKKFYGDGSKYTLIAEANGLDENASLKEGMEITIPPKA